MTIETILKEFAKIHYEPEHEKGQTCWCEPKSIVKEGVLHIEHQEQRIILKSFLQEKMSALLSEVKREIDAIAFEQQDIDKVRLFVDWEKAAAIVESKK